MLNKLENWLLNVFAGKVLARVAVTIVGLVSAAPVQALLSQLGVTVAINPTELTAGMIALAHTVFEYFKKRRAANPASPVVQTDVTLPGGIGNTPA